MRDRPLDELRALAAQGRIQDLPASGRAAAASSSRHSPARCPNTSRDSKPKPRPTRARAREIHAALAGDLHLHSDWSDGGATIEAMANKAAELGHRYLALTDHSPQLTVAHGLTPERLREQLDVVAG